MFLAPYILRLFIFLFLTVYCKSDCITSINSFKNILAFKNNEILLSNDGIGNIVIKNNDFIVLGCPGGRIQDINTELAQFTCINNVFILNNRQYPNIGSVTCKDTISPVEKYINACNNGNSWLQIGFQFGNPAAFFPQIELCWDNTKKRTLYTYAILKKQLGECHVESSRPTFRSGAYFDSSLANWYTKHGQVYNLCEAYTPIPPQIDVFNNLLEIGHLVAKCDFVYDAQQKLTFQYTNAAPQWKSFNGGNWKLLEADIRKLVTQEKTDLDIYTGTYDTLKFGAKAYYLNNKKSEVPVPLYFWKVVIKKESPTSTLGLAIIGINDIFMYNPINNPCPDIYDQVNWLTKTNAKKVRSGYMIACDVNDFKNINGLNTQLPNFPIVTGRLLGQPPTGKRSAPTPRQRGVGH